YVSRKRCLVRGRWYSTVARFTSRKDSLRNSHTAFRSRRWMRRTVIVCAFFLRRLGFGSSSCVGSVAGRSEGRTGCGSRSPSFLVAVSVERVRDTEPAILRGFVGRRYDDRDRPAVVLDPQREERLPLARAA